MPNFYNCEQIVWKQKDFLEGIKNVANRGICFALSISWLSLCYKRIHLTDDDLLIARIKDAFEETTKHKMILSEFSCLLYYQLANRLYTERNWQILPSINDSTFVLSFKSTPTLGETSNSRYIAKNSLSGIDSTNQIKTQRY